MIYPLPPVPLWIKIAPRCISPPILQGKVWGRLLLAKVTLRNHKTCPLECGWNPRWMKYVLGLWKHQLHLPFWKLERDAPFKQRKSCILIVWWVGRISVSIWKSLPSLKQFLSLPLGQGAQLEKKKKHTLDFSPLVTSIQTVNNLHYTVCTWAHMCQVNS